MDVEFGFDLGLIEWAVGRNRFDRMTAFQWLWGTKMSGSPRNLSHHEILGPRHRTRRFWSSGYLG